MFEENAPDALGLRLVAGGQELEAQSVEWIDQARHCARAVLEPEAAAQRDQLHEGGRDEHGRDIGDAPLGQLDPRFFQRCARQHAELAEDRHARDAPVAFERAMHDHRHVEMVCQQREQRHQVGMLQRAVVARDHQWAQCEPRGRRRREPVEAAACGPVETRELLRQHGIHCERREQRAEFQFGHTAVEERREKLERLGFVHCLRTT